MIFEAIVSVFAGFVSWVFSLLPNDDPPAWLLSSTGALRTVWSYAAGLGAWIPWDVAGYVVAAVLSCVGIGLAIKVLRIVASFFTAGGGSAA